MTERQIPILQIAAGLEHTQHLCGQAASHLRNQIGTDATGRISIETLESDYQIAANDLVVSTTWLAVARQLLGYAERFGTLEKSLALLFAAEAIEKTMRSFQRRPEEFGFNATQAASLAHEPAIHDIIRSAFRSERWSEVAREVLERGGAGELGLNGDQEMMRQAIRSLAEEKIAPTASSIHRNDLLVPEEIIREVARIGCFGLSIPKAYGGIFEDVGNMGMVIATEELSRISLGSAGSLITRPEIVAKALLKGGTQDQKAKWLPLIAKGEKMVAVATTEPDHGSDLAQIRFRATRADGGGSAGLTAGWRLTGEKTLATFAGRAEILLVLARTDPDVAKRHRGLSLFLVEKPAFRDGPNDRGKFRYEQPKGGTLEGSAIPMIGYRGMHTYALKFEGYFVPPENLIGGESGLGQGFYLQMAGFEGGRLQTAARANGLMEAALEKTLAYVRQRHAFGRTIADFQLTHEHLVRMAMLLQASRQFSYHAARAMDQGDANILPSMAKFFSSRVAQEVTYRAQQLHGGMGYTEEFDVSRHAADARVLTIFEGAEEVLSSRVIARFLLEKQVS